MSVWDAARGERVGQDGRVECDVMGVDRADGDGTCIHSFTRRRWRESEFQGVLGQGQTPRRAFASAVVPLERCRIRPV